jgi:hypothetical protein
VKTRRTHDEHETKETEMTRTELKAKAEHYRKLAEKAPTVFDRDMLLRKALRYYSELEMSGMVQWCNRFLTS